MTALLHRLNLCGGAFCVFRAYLLRIAALLLQAKDFDDHIGLSHPFTAYLLRIAALADIVPRP